MAKIGLRVIEQKVEDERSSTGESVATAPESPTIETLENDIVEDMTNEFSLLYASKPTEYPVYRPSESAEAPDSEQSSNEDTSDLDSTLDEASLLVAYCAESCPKNGHRGCIAGIGVWFEDNDRMSISERCPNLPTSNRAELIAIARVLEAVDDSKKPIIIRSTSQYAINCITAWISVWRNNSYITTSGTPVKNRSLIEYVDALVQLRNARGQRTEFEYVWSKAPGMKSAKKLADNGVLERKLSWRDWEAERKDVEKKMNGIV